MTTEDRIYDALSELGGIDTHDVSLRDNPKAHEVLARLLAQAATEDTKRLDHLDARNAAKNARIGTTYGWRLNENHNRIALEDHAWPPFTVRAAIDADMAAHQLPALSAGGIAYNDPPGSEPARVR